MTRLDGADLAHYQTDGHPIDWPTLRAATFWCAHKATQGSTSKDPTFPANWQTMAEQAFTYRGAYHWLSPNVDPTAQASHFLRTVGSLGTRTFAMLDAEEGGITVPQAAVWLEAVEAQIRRPCAVYTGAHTVGGQMWRDPTIRVSAFGPRPMHLAAYVTEQKALDATAGFPWDAWQYSSDGPVPGVTGRCDMNRIDNLDAYNLACGVNTVGDDMPIILTNSQTYGGFAPGVVKLAYDGIVKRQLSAEYGPLFGVGAPYASPGTPMTNAQLAAIPDYVAPILTVPPITVPPAQPPAGGWPVHLVLALDAGTADGKVG